MLAKSNVILSFQLCANCCDQKPVTPPLCKHPPCTKDLNQNKNKRADRANQTICWIYCSACAPSVMLAKSNVILSFQLCANCCYQKPVTPPLCKHPPCTKDLNQNKNKRADHANQTICWIYCSACAPSVMLAKSNVILSFQLCANCRGKKPVTPLHHHFASTRHAQKISIKTRTNGQIMQIRPSVGFTAPHVRPQSCWLSQMSSCHFNYVQIAATRNLLHHHFASTRHAQKISIKTRTNGQIMQIRPSVGFTAPHVRPQSCWLSQMSSCHFNYVQIAATRNLLHHHFASTRHAQKISIKTRTNGQIMQIRPSVGFTAPHVRPQSCWLSQMSSCHFNYDANQTICWIYCSACAPSVMLAKSNVILSFQLCANCCDQKPVTPPLCKHPPCTKDLNQNKNKRADHANQTICWIYCSACAPSVMLAKSNVILSFQLCANCCDQKPVTPPLCKHPPCTKDLNQNKNKRADHANQTICWIYCSACAPSVTSVMLAKSNVILSFQLCS